MSVYLTMEEGDKGLHKGVQAWNDLLKKLRGPLTFVKQWGVTQGVSRFHGKLLLGIVRFAKPQKCLRDKGLAQFKMERQSK